MSQSNELPCPCWVQLRSCCCLVGELNLKAQRYVGWHPQEGIVHWIGEGPLPPVQHEHWTHNCLELATSGPEAV